MSPSTPVKKFAVNGQLFEEEEPSNDDEEECLETRESELATLESHKQFQNSISRFSFTGSSSKHSPVHARATAASPSMTLKSSSQSTIASLTTSPRKRPRTLLTPPTAEDASPSKKPAKRKKPARRYSSPGVYSHLNNLNDCISESLDIIFCGINPGQRSAEIGHHFGHPSNHFWKCLHLSGLTPDRIPPTEDFTLPERYQLGLWRDQQQRWAPFTATELKDSEFKEGIAPFLSKLARYRPRMACFIGLRTGRIVLDYVMRSRPKAERPSFRPGLQPYKLVHSRTDNPEAGQETLFYCIPSTSGKTQGYQIPDKVKMFTQLGADLAMVKKGDLFTTGFLKIVPPDDNEEQVSQPQDVP
ncbi:uracil-DNA glycosylase-like protein [Lentinula raphanica]|nr:uracil-DNA glycosylase-like protein [Lentinula raphanica]